ncbi:tyrosine-type recombinase/integrase [Actinomadura latina]|uniref:Tyrosine-type recombinase/integrase n=2 Tax=Actinomadura latina TaxID=163603 RepID=A0A846Z5U1_9ACTN|nr:tyrosine-type recombinase/integrase [Actinomadura latina]
MHHRNLAGSDADAGRRDRAARRAAVPSHGLGRGETRPDDSTGETPAHQTKTDGSTDVLPLPSLCMAALRLRETQQVAERDACDDWQESDLVFTTRTGRPIEPRNVNRAFESRCAAAGVKVIRVHDTRHTCGKLLAALDVHPRVAMQILRHSKISLTMEIYTEVPSEQTRAALKRLGEHLGSGDDSGEASA